MVTLVDATSHRAMEMAHHPLLVVETSRGMRSVLLPARTGSVRQCPPFVFLDIVVIFKHTVKNMGFFSPSTWRMRKYWVQNRLVQTARPSSFPRSQIPLFPKRRIQRTSAEPGLSRGLWAVLGGPVLCTHGCGSCLQAQPGSCPSPTLTFQHSARPFSK